MAFFASISSRVLQSSAGLAHHNRTKISRPPQCRSFSPLPPVSFPSKRCISALLMSFCYRVS
ncbi:hypothetical protein Patl1_29142 [Pistacia atlantica]|uniref:Uncharacterized protein n=1 Tax=Pistacia atlantica TaxID=434234 RepID=A0ACC1BFT4_9ROSI|nr:hypothetical protein Patl1_29142 [Pistacia atlantica]